MSCAKWLHARDVAVLGGDGAQDVLPSGVAGISQPIHTLALVAMGMPIFDNCDLELIGKGRNAVTVGSSLSLLRPRLCLARLAPS